MRRVTRVDEFGADADSGLAVLVRVMEVGLHAHIPTLKQALAAAVDAMAPAVDAVLLGYGLCGNALKDLDALFPDVAVPVILPTDNGEPVDDCVGLIIGGRENYYSEQCRCAGTMFMNAGFSRHWSKDPGSRKCPKSFSTRRTPSSNASWRTTSAACSFPPPCSAEAELRRNTREFSERHNLRTEIRPGTLSLLEKAWSGAKQAAGHPGRVNPHRPGPRPTDSPIRGPLHPRISRWGSHCSRRMGSSRVGHGCFARVMSMTNPMLASTSSGVTPG